jgi:hypothetical protein
MRTEEEKKLRRLLAYQHHHFKETNTIYCDDGELQCSLCTCDFIRDSADVLLNKIKKYNLEYYESCIRAAEEA